jgi:hypothetical protein
MRSITATRAEGQSIGELSRATGVNIETIRYYERIKMLPSPRRTEGGHRVYGPAERRSLAFIRRAREFWQTERSAFIKKRAGSPPWFLEVGIPKRGR